MKSTVRIVFFGTPQIALESLKAIVESGYHVAGVVTAPDKPAGRGMKLRASPVKQYAVDRGITVLQPERMSDPAFLAELKGINPDLQIVVAFRMMPQAVWEMPGLGTINLHASLLPQYRGAAPINWAVINGETVTGLTTFFLQHKIDTGNIIYRESLSIGPHETAGELHERMKVAGAALVIRTIDSIISGNVQTINQEDLIDPDIPLKPAPKIYTETCEIDWNMPSADIYNMIRGLSPVPAAFTEIKLNDGTLAAMKIFRAGIENQAPVGYPGMLSTDGRYFLKISASDGDIIIYELQLAGRKPMKTEEFLRGFGRNII
ncbi:MAG: methionyl-tRNA formyltransferase [Bacteroidetes bacterium]|nr:methionyl-tRNA formyltransferase [Bacteroidota bacterium]